MLTFDAVKSYATPLVGVDAAGRLARKVVVFQRITGQSVTLVPHTVAERSLRCTCSRCDRGIHIGRIEMHHIGGTGKFDRNTDGSKKSGSKLVASIFSAVKDGGTYTYAIAPVCESCHNDLEEEEEDAGLGE